MIRVVQTRLTEPKPETGFFGPKTETENRVSKNRENRKPGPKTAGFSVFEITKILAIFR